MISLKQMLARTGQTARRGIKPPTHRHSSLRSRIMPTPLPDELKLSLRQSNTGPMQACVEPGEWVAKFQLLAKSDSPYRSRLHAPTSGTVTAIEELPAPSNGAPSQQVICLQIDHEERCLPLEPPADYRTLAPEELTGIIEEAGICGMGGAGFPTAQKIKAAVASSVSTLIINGVECEPYISCDEALIRERSQQLVEGAEILQAACLSRRCVIAIDDSMEAAQQALSNSLQGSSVELKIVKRRYPAGDERQLVKAVTGREVPSGKLAIDIGVLVQNAGTAIATQEAVINARPCISRVVTLVGAPLQTPKNFDVAIGTPVQHLLDLCGIDSASHDDTLIGGSLMGQRLLEPAASIGKTTNCIIATSSQEFPEPTSEQACIRCAYCEQACPAQLQPQLLLSSIRADEWDRVNALGLRDCIECGACAYVCPSKIPLVQYYRSAKESIGLEKQAHNESQQWQERFQYHQYRIKKNQEKARDKKSATKQTEKDNTFSRSQAKLEISAAVERVKRRKLQQEKST